MFPVLPVCYISSFPLLLGTEHIVECKECGLNFTQWENYKTHLHQHALEEDEAQSEELWSADLVSGRVDPTENGDEDMIDDAAECDPSDSPQTVTCDLSQSDGASTPSVHLERLMLA